MQESLSISIEELLPALKRKGIPLPFEIGTFIALEACEQIMQSPALVTKKDVWIDFDGNVFVEQSQQTTSQEESRRYLLDLLTDILVAAAPGIPEPLLTLIQQDGVPDREALSNLRDDLEATLIPLNRSATRRVLARLLRESQRESGTSKRVSAPPDASQLDQEFDRMFSGEKRERPDSNPTAQTNENSAQTVKTSTPPYNIEADQEVRLRGFETAVKGRGGSKLIWLLSLLAVLLFIILVIVYLHKYLVQQVSVTELSPNTEMASPPPHSKVSPSGHLSLETTPLHAQILLFLGESPVSVEALPLGIAHEFVALKEGFKPTRALVKDSARWTECESGRCQELRISAELISDSSRPVDLGMSILPHRMGTPSTETGTVRIITDPPQMRIYQVVGFTPNLQVDHLQVDTDNQFLVYTQGYDTEQLSITPDQWHTDSTGEKRVDLDIALRSYR